MTKTLIVVRHGQYIKTRPREHLTAVGQFQAGDIALQLVRNSLTPDIILYSDTPRTEQTARCLSFSFGGLAKKVPLKKADCLREQNHKDVPSLFRQLDDRQSVILAVTHSFNLAVLAKAFDIRIQGFNAETVALSSEVESWGKFDHPATRKFVPAQHTH